MCVCRKGAGVGVLDGVLYAVGGHDGLKCLSSVETYRPNIGVWTSIADMHMPRRDSGILFFNSSNILYEHFFFVNILYIT